MDWSEQARNSLAEYAVADEMLAAAYEETGAQQRALLKTTIARLFEMWGESPVESSASRTAKSGLKVDRVDRAAPFLFVFCPAQYEYAHALLAAVLPGIFAGISHIIPCFLPSFPDAFVAADPMPALSLNHEKNGMPIAPPLLAALELAGVSDAYIVSVETARDHLIFLSKNAGVGRMIVLGGAALVAPVILAAHECGIPCSCLGRMPYARRQSLQPASEGTFCGMAMRTVVSEAHFPLWVWPELEPSWFRNVSYSFS